MESCFLNVSCFGHHGEVGLYERSQLNLGLNFIFLHLGVVVESEHVEEVVVHLDVCSALVVRERLEANGSKVRQVDCALDLSLAIAPPI